MGFLDTTNPRNLHEYECGIHKLTYRATRAGCPVCKLERENQEMREAIRDLKNKLELVTNSSNKFKVLADGVAAIRAASGVLGGEDMAFLKAVLYQWRDEKSIGGMKIVHDKDRTPIGFLVLPRQGDPYAHTCTSAGGLAIVLYYEEAVNTTGPAKAMELLVKGMAMHLPGAM